MTLDPRPQMDSPAVSVVIPAYNAAAFIQKTLASVAAQTYSDYEIVVIDDGSSDDTGTIVQEYLKRQGLPGACIRQENKGIAGARNTGVRRARGRWIAFLDHDDAWFPDKLRIIMEEFSLYPEAGLVCHNENIVEEGRWVGMGRYGPWTPRMYTRLLFKGNTLSPSCVTVKREKVLEVGGFRENPEFNTVEDYDLWMRLSRVCRFHFTDHVLGEYQLVERAASRRIEYHHANLEAVLRDHFRSHFGPSPGFLARLRMRRRLSGVYRSALGQLMRHRESLEKQRQYAGKMLREFPWDPKNLLRALIWVTGTY